MMGRSASHIALESALLTRPNYCFIGGFSIRNSFE